MEWPDVVAITVGCFSIILAVSAIIISTINYDRTKDVLAEISQKAAVIEGTVSETQGKLVDTVIAIATPKEETQEDRLLRFVSPLMAENPELIERLAKLGEQHEKPPS